MIRIGCCALLCALAACTTTIAPPSSLRVPVEIIVVDHGRTTSLVVPSTDGGTLRYAYGDWNWYALGRTDIYHGIAALLWPTRGALGRAYYDGAATVETIRAHVHSIEALYYVRVEREYLQRFEQSMESLYAARKENEHESSLAGLRFVPHPRAYTYFWNSNHAVASWLRELGCRTRGPAFRASWQVESAAEP